MAEELPPGGKGPGPNPNGEYPAGGRESFFGSGDGGGQQQATAGSAPAAFQASDGNRELAFALLQAVDFAAARRGPTAHPGTSPIELRQKIDMRSWDGKFQSGQSVVDAFRVFRNSFYGRLSAEGLDGVLWDSDIEIGAMDADLDLLRARFEN